MGRMLLVWALLSVTLCACQGAAEVLPLPCVDFSGRVWEVGARSYLDNFKLLTAGENQDRFHAVSGVDHLAERGVQLIDSRLVQGVNIHWGAIQCNGSVPSGQEISQRSGISELARLYDGGSPQ